MTHPMSKSSLYNLPIKGDIGLHQNIEVVMLESMMISSQRTKIYYGHEITYDIDPCGNLISGLSSTMFSNKYL